MSPGHGKIVQMAESNFSTSIQSTSKLHMDLKQPSCFYPQLREGLDHVELMPNLLFRSSPELAAILLALSRLMGQHVYASDRWVSI
jgi:hypothetical protein